MDTMQGLIIAKDSEEGRILSAMLGQCGVKANVCSSVDEAKSVMSRNSVGLILCQCDLAFASLLDPAHRGSAEGDPGVLIFCTKSSPCCREEAEKHGFHCICYPLCFSDLEELIGLLRIRSEVRRTDSLQDTSRL